MISRALRVLRRGWMSVAIVVVLGALCGAGLAHRTTRVYRATAQVLVSSTGRTPTAADLAALADGATVARVTVRRLGLAMSADTLAGKVSAGTAPGSAVVTIDVSDTQAVRSARLANAVADEFGRAAHASSPTIRTSLTRAATVPAGPVSPRPGLDVGLGALIGLLVGALGVLVTDAARSRITDPDDVTRLGAPVLGAIHVDERLLRFPLATGTATFEACRLLATRVRQAAGPAKVIAVTSAAHHEGRTTVAANLAAALAQAGSRVCLVEFDLRRPLLARALDLSDEAGLGACYRDGTAAAAVAEHLAHNLAVVVAGPPSGEPADNLTDVAADVRTAAILAEIAAEVDYAVVDTAPLLDGAGTAHIAAVADATVAVYRAGWSNRRRARAARAVLLSAGRPPIGAVLTTFAPRLNRPRHPSGARGLDLVDDPGEHGRDLEVLRGEDRRHAGVA